MNERERVESSNEIANIVFDQVKRAWPDLHPVFDLRYGIADAVLAAGYRKSVTAETCAWLIDDGDGGSVEVLPHDFSGDGWTCVNCLKPAPEET